MSEEFFVLNSFLTFDIFKKLYFIVFFLYFFRLSLWEEISIADWPTLLMFSVVYFRAVMCLLFLVPLCVFPLFVLPLFAACLLFSMFFYWAWSMTHARGPRKKWRTITDRPSMWGPAEEKPGSRTISYQPRGPMAWNWWWGGGVFKSVMNRYLNITPPSGNQLVINFLTKNPPLRFLEWMVEYPEILGCMRT